MGAPISEVGHTSATTGRGDHEIYMDLWWHWEEKRKKEKKNNFHYGMPINT
jgi:hypothetical protein